LQNSWLSFRILNLMLDDIGSNHTLLSKAGISLKELKAGITKPLAFCPVRLPIPGELFPNPTIADAIMNRVIHDAYILALDTNKSI